jgi:hypothetical protein
MRARTPVILLFTGALGVLAYRRALSRLVSSVFARSLRRGLALAAYRHSRTREHIPQQDLLQQRNASDEWHMTAGRSLFGQLLERTKSQYDLHNMGERQPPVIDVLIISGGGDWGAFGAGFLKGWQKVPDEHPLAKPEFDAVTGVSTGTLIAPFAFLGDPQSIDQIANLYRNPEQDWVKQNGLLYFLPDNISFAEVPGLERKLREHVTLDMVRRIAKAGSDGRLLLVNTTNLDHATPRVFDLVEEARLASDSGQLERIHNIMLASAGIPGAFPFRMIDQELYVDGGVTGNIIYGGRIGEEDSLPGLWQKAYPNLPTLKLRFWVVFNNQFRPVPEVTPPNWVAVIERSLHTATRASTATAVRHLFAMAEIAKLKRKVDVQVRVVSIPADWSPAVPGTFRKQTMNNLVDLGEKMGADPSSWSDQPPGF